MIRGVMTAVTTDLLVLYQAKKGVVEIVDVPELGCVLVGGEGAPGGPAFTAALQALYAVSYGAHTSVPTPPRAHRSCGCTRASPRQAAGRGAGTTRSISATLAAARLRGCARSSATPSSHSPVQPDPAQSQRIGSRRA